MDLLQAEKAVVKVWRDLNMAGSPPAVRVIFVPQAIVEHGFGQVFFTEGLYEGKQHRITFWKMPIDPSNLLHELAHAITWEGAETWEQAHSSRWAEVYADLILKYSKGEPLPWRL